MRVVLALLLALCVANAANIRSKPTAQTTETVKRSPRFAFHTYETQMMAKGDDGEEGESFVSMLPESMFIEMGGSDGEGGAGAATGSQAAPESESKDATGSSTGATGQTGSTGATGQTGATGATAMTGNDEEPAESMDKVLTGQMALGGVLKSNFNPQAQKVFQQTLSKLLEVPVNKVIIAGVAEMGTQPVAAPAASRRRLLEDNSGVMVDFIVSEISKSAGDRIVQTLESRSSDMVSLLSQSNTAAFATITSAIANKPKLASMGQGTSGGCQDKVLQKIVEIKSTGGDGSDLPTHMKEFCKTSFDAKKHQLGIDDKVVSTTCQDAYTVVENIPLKDRFGKASETATSFCKLMRKFFEKIIRAQGAGAMSIGMASSVSEINKESPGNGVTSCCVPHQSAGCYDKAIQDCVCKAVLAGGKKSKFGKKDEHCCGKSWDLTCTENVEFFHCAGCPQEAFFRR